MRRTLPLWLTALGLLALAPDAHAQFGAPVQKPGVDPQGTLLVTPAIGVIHEGGADFGFEGETGPPWDRHRSSDGGLTDFSLGVRTRYSIFNDTSLSAQIGGILGDLDAFVLGFGGKVQFLRHKDRLPIDVSAFTALDLGLDDATALTWMIGPLVGGEIRVAPVEITPYAGLGLGLTYLKPEGENDGATEAAVGFVLGCEVAFSRDLAAFTEFTLGTTDGLPILNWQLGVSYAVVAPLASAAGSP